MQLKGVQDQVILYYKISIERQNLNEIKMQESENSSGFSFGSVEETFYENMNQEIQIGKLPYNPFLFDLTLRLKSSTQGYEKQGLEIQLNSSSVNMFGRKGKKKKQEDSVSTAVKRHQFLAETMSRTHFSIDTQHQLCDDNSKKGTYILIHRNEPKLLQVHDSYLLNTVNISVNSINKVSQKIELQLPESKTLTLNPKLFKERVFLMGSNKKCHYVNKELEPFHLGIDLFALTVHSLIEDEDCESGKGTWMKVKEPVKISGGDMIMAFPYVFEVLY